ncbi:MAG: Crp/Fnr family transcriptional regulator [Acidobacteria bacterium]|nr:Crp/Fnr family transcriptional regulator [Acidobacteriota bacterium]
MLRLAHESAGFGYELARLTALRIRRFRARVEPLLGGTAHACVAQALLALAAEHGVADAHGVLIPLRLTQTELAALAGVTRETVNAVLGDLRVRGLVEMGRHSIRVSRPEGLRLAMDRAQPHRAAARRGRTLASGRRVGPRSDEPVPARRSAGADRRAAAEGLKAEGQ